jgi:hypothetical protein
MYETPIFPLLEWRLTQDQIARVVVKQTTNLELTPSEGSDKRKDHACARHNQLKDKQGRRTAKGESLTRESSL